VSQQHAERAREEEEEEKRMKNTQKCMQWAAKQRYYAQTVGESTTAGSVVRWWCWCVLSVCVRERKDNRHRRRIFDIVSLVQEAKKKGKIFISQVASLPLSLYTHSLLFLH
jgi:ATPase subunit of ABC transporter with duplicated ATPase domains